jgi:hypothetical protein
MPHRTDSQIKPNSIQGSIGNSRQKDLQLLYTFGVCKGCLQDSHQRRKFPDRPAAEQKKPVKTDSSLPHFLLAELQGTPSHFLRGALHGSLAAAVRFYQQDTFVLVLANTSRQGENWDPFMTLKF